MVLNRGGEAYIGHASANFIRWRPVAGCMEIEFVTYATIRDAVDEKRITREFSEGTTVTEAVDALAAEYDELGPLLLNGDGEMRLNVNVLRNEENVRHEDGGETVLSDGDTVGLAPGLSGGSRARLGVSA